SLSKRAQSSRVAAAVLPQPRPQLPSLATDAASRAELLEPRLLFRPMPRHLGQNEVGVPRPPGGARAPSKDPVARPPSACVPPPPWSARPLEQHGAETIFGVKRCYVSVGDDVVWVTGPPPAVLIFRFQPAGTDDHQHNFARSDLAVQMRLEVDPRRNVVDIHE